MLIKIPGAMIAAVIGYISFQFSSLTMRFTAPPNVFQPIMLLFWALFVLDIWYVALIWQERAYTRRLADVCSLSPFTFKIICTLSLVFAGLLGLIDVALASH